MTMASDHELMAACTRGEAAAFEQVVLRHLDAVQCYLAARCPRWSEVEEVGQETFVRAWEYCDRFDGKSALRSWLIGIARNVLSEHRRERRRRGPSLDALLDDPAAEDEDDAAEEILERRLEAMRGCLERLGPRARRLLAARYGERRPLSDLARAFKKKTSALSRELQRLALGLRDCVHRGTA